MSSHYPGSAFDPRSEVVLSENTVFNIGGATWAISLAFSAPLSARGWTPLRGDVGLTSCEMSMLGRDPFPAGGFRGRWRVPETPLYIDEIQA